MNNLEMEKSVATNVDELSTDYIITDEISLIKQYKSDKSNGCISSDPRENTSIMDNSCVSSNVIDDSKYLKRPTSIDIKINENIGDSTCITKVTKKDNNISIENNRYSTDSNINTQIVDDKNLDALPYSAFSKTEIIIIFSIIIYIGFLGPMSGNIYIPALPLLQEEFNVSTNTINATVSVFMAVFSLGPLFWAMHADFGGRKLLYIISLLLTTIVNLLLATVPANINGLYILRILQAFSSSSVMSLGAGTVSDIISPSNRGKAISYFMLGPNAGPILAPIIAGLVLAKSDHWRWLFGIITLLSMIALVIVIIFLPETLRCIVGNGDPRWKYGYLQSLNPKLIKQESNNLTFWKNIGIQTPVSDSPEFKTLYPRPIKPSLQAYWELLKNLPVLISSTYTSLLFATYYAFAVTLSYYLKIDYGLNNLEIGACYVCPGIGLMLGSIAGGHISDTYRKFWLKAHEGATFPLERRLYLQILGLLTSIVACVGYGWAIHYHLHLYILLLFSFFIALGMTWCTNTTMTYLTEYNPKRTAGTIAVSSFFRNTAAAISSAIIFQLSNEMGVGWCFTGLGICNLFSIMGIMYLILYGEKL